MSAIAGLRITGFVPTGGSISQAMMQDISALSPAPHHLQLSMSIDVDGNNHVNMQALKASLQQIKDSGFDPPWIVIQGGMEERYQKLTGPAYLAAMPNAVLGYNGDLMLNDYIDKLSLSVVGTALALGDLCPPNWIIWNEGNLDGPNIKPGVKPPRLQDLAPSVYGAMVGTTAKRLRASVPAVQNIYPGSLSCLVKADTDPGGPMVAGYLSQAFEWMNAHGTNAPYDFAGMCLNMEGVITDKYSAWCAGAVTKIMRTYGIEGQSVIGEYGLPNSTIAQDHLDMGASFKALCDHWSYVFAFCYLAQVPNSLGSYSMATWGINGQGLMVPYQHSPMYATYQTACAALYGVPVPPAPIPSPVVPPVTPA